MTTTKRLKRLALMLFTSEISKEEKQAALGVVNDLDAAISDIEKLISKIQKNIDLFATYTGKPESLLSIKSNFEKSIDKHKDSYEQILYKIRTAFKNMDSFKDIKLQDDVLLTAQEGEIFTDLFNEYLEISRTIGKPEFLEEFKNKCNEIIQRSQNFSDVIQSCVKHINKNILEKQPIS